MNNPAKLKHPFSLEDIFGLRKVTDASISPDGTLAICVVTTSFNNSWKDTIIVIDLLTSNQKVIIEGSSPQWSPKDSGFAYISWIQDIPSIFIYNLNEGSTEFLVHIYNSDYFIDHYTLKNFCWSPDGKTIAYLSTDPSVNSSGNFTTREFNDLLYRSKGGSGRSVYADPFKTHIWLASLPDKSVKRLFESNFDEHSISFSPGGKKICFISNTSGAPDLNQWSDVFIADIESAEITRVSHEKGSAFQPVWSPDGLHLAYLGIKSEISTNDSPAEDTQLYLIPSAGGTAECLTGELNRRIEQVSWEPLSEYIYFTAGDAGTTSLYRVSLTSKEIEIIIGEKGKVTEYAIGNNNKDLLFIHTDSIHLPDIFLFNLNDKTFKRLTHFREELLDKCLLQPSETFWYKSFDDLDIQGWLMKPVHFRAHEKYPLVLVIHGGPHNMFGYEFEERMQFLSANGYAVLFINPRGSSGYGQEFSNGCMKAWGEGDYEDLMKGLDIVMKENPWIDKLALGVTGQSYGGYMTNRIITKTNRFKAAVADGSISNLVSFAGTSLYHSLMESEFQMPVMNNWDLLWNCSPIKDVKNVSTPVLFLHGETDNEVPQSQAEEMFIAVKKLGVKTAFIQYVKEGHGWRPDLKPQNKTDLLQRMVRWFDEHLKDNSGVPSNLYEP